MCLAHAHAHAHGHARVQASESVADAARQAAEDERRRRERAEGHACDAAVISATSRSSSLSNWARTVCGWIPPRVSGVAETGDRQAAHQERRPFTPAEMQALLNAPVFRGWKSPKRIGQAGAYRWRDGRFWFGLIQMVTGCRIDRLPEWRTRSAPGDGRRPAPRDLAFRHSQGRQDPGRMPASRSAATLCAACGTFREFVDIHRTVDRRQGRVC